MFTFLKTIYLNGEVAALVPDMFYNFNLVENHKIGNNSETSEAKEKYKLIFPNFNSCLT
jgi:hypothetical protein